MCMWGRWVGDNQDISSLCYMSYHTTERTDWVVLRGGEWRSMPFTGRLWLHFDDSIIGFLP